MRDNRAGNGYSIRILPRCCIPCTVVVLLSILFVPPEVRAQDIAPVWSAPLLLNEGQDGNSPDVVADSTGAVHVFWGSIGEEGAAGAIFYRHLEDGSWSAPVDILVGPDPERAVMPQAAIDSDGWLHLVWESSGVYYSRAPVEAAGSAHAWSPPIRLSEGQATTPQIIIDNDNHLHVIYVDIFVSPYVRYTASEDGGIKWTTPVAVSAPQNNAYALNARLLIDGQQTLHAVWSESIEIFPPSGIYYASSNDMGETWTAPTELASGGYSWASVGIDGEGAIHVFWTGTAEWVGKYHTWSQNGGQSWQPVEQLWPGTGGLLGFADMASDSTETLHLVAAAGSGTFFPVGTPGEILETIWSRDMWTRLSHISRPIMDSEREHSSPQVTIARGNVAHLVWGMLDHARTEPDQYEYIWYSTATLPAPELAARPIPESTSIPANDDTAAEQIGFSEGVAQTLTPTQTAWQGTAAPPYTSPLVSIALAMGSALLLVALVILRYFLSRSSSNHGR